MDNPIIGFTGSYIEKEFKLDVPPNDSNRLENIFLNHLSKAKKLKITNVMKYNRSEAIIDLDINRTLTCRHRVEDNDFAITLKYNLPTGRRKITAKILESEAKTDQFLMFLENINSWGIVEKLACVSGLTEMDIDIINKHYRKPLRILSRYESHSHRYKIGIKSETDDACDVSFDLIEAENLTFAEAEIETHDSAVFSQIIADILIFLSESNGIKIKKLPPTSNKPLRIISFLNSNSTH